jgi:hypothetical protein
LFVYHIISLKTFCQGKTKQLFKPIHFQHGIFKFYLIIQHTCVEATLVVVWDKTNSTPFHSSFLEETTQMHTNTKSTNIGNIASMIISISKNLVYIYKQGWKSIHKKHKACRSKFKHTKGKLRHIIMN